MLFRCLTCLSKSKEAWIVKARQVNFFIDPDMQEEVFRVIDEDVLPRYKALPHFVGMMLAEGPIHTKLDGGRRREMLGVSLWDDSLDDSDSMVAHFRRRLLEISHETVAQKDFGVVRFVVERMPEQK